MPILQSSGLPAAPGLTRSFPCLSPGGTRAEWQQYTVGRGPNTPIHLHLDAQGRHSGDAAPVQAFEDAQLVAWAEAAVGV